MKAFKKPVTVEYCYIHEPCVVETLEGPVRADHNHVMMTGVRREKYPIPRTVFERDYERVGTTSGYCWKKRIVVDVEVLTEPTAVKVDWCDDMLNGKPGDYLVTHQDGSKGIVEKSIFEETYEVVEE